WYSAIACWPSRDCCSFLNGASARRCAIGEDQSAGIAYPANFNWWGAPTRRILVIAITSRITSTVLNLPCHRLKGHFLGLEVRSNAWRVSDRQARRRRL